MIRMDYCNNVLIGVSVVRRRLQSVRNSDASLIIHRKKFDPITEIIRNKLHWLPVTNRIIYKPDRNLYMTAVGACCSASRQSISAAHTVGCVC